MYKFSKRIKKKPILVMILIFFGLFILSSVCLIYSILKIDNIENLLRYLVCLFLFLLLLFNIIQCFKIIYKGKTLRIITFGIVLLALFVGESYTCGIINGIYKSIDNIYKQTYTYTTSLITMSNSKIKKIENVKNLKIGMINDENSIDGYELAKNIIDENNLDKNNEIVNYNSVGEIINKLYNKEINAALVSSTYTSMFSNVEEYKNINEETKVIYSKSKTIKKENNITEKNENSPFTILVMGIDSTIDDISKVTAFNADSLMLITFNPTTYNATILSIPRDTYVPISCLKDKPKSKITHSGWYSETCVMQTIEDWMDIKIDYYIKINFTGVVNLVDAIDGINVNVPYSFCEQNSKREWGKNTIYVKSGLQTLTGEQALALSRNRHPNIECGSAWTNYSSSDIIRGQNQQLIINAIINKITKNIDLNKIYSILNIIGKNMDTNMTTNEILSFYNLAKKITLNSINSENIITFERLYLSTYGKFIYDSLMKMPLSDQIYYNDSFNAIVNEMKINLNIVKPDMIKTFSFSVNSPYKTISIGNGVFTQNDIETVPSFIGKEKDSALSWAKSKGIEVKIEYKEVDEGIENKIIAQSIPYSSILQNVNKSNGLTITLAKITNQKKIDENDDNLKKYPTE